jgi:hypothetical protein
MEMTAVPTRHRPKAEGDKTMPVLKALRALFREYEDMMEHARTGRPPRQWARDRQHPYVAPSRGR